MVLRDPQSLRAAKFHRAGIAHGSVKLTNVFSMTDVAEAVESLYGQYVGSVNGLATEDGPPREGGAASRVQSFAHGHGQRRRSAAGKHAAAGTQWSQHVLLVDGSLYERCEEFFQHVDANSTPSFTASAIFSPHLIRSTTLTLLGCRHVQNWFCDLSRSMSLAPKSVRTDRCCPCPRRTAEGARSTEETGTAVGLPCT